MIAMLGETSNEASAGDILLDFHLKYFTKKACTWQTFTLNSNPIYLKEKWKIALITVTSGLDTQTRPMGPFPLY